MNGDKERKHWIYDMTKWEEYQPEKKQYVCDSCMFADLFSRKE